MIELRNVTKEYNENLESFKALDDVSLSIFESSVGIVGYSGAGKSTLVRLINGLIEPTSGSIFVEGKEINKLSRKELNETKKNIGMVFQHFNLLLQSTVYQNIKEALKISKYPNKEIDSRIDELLKSVDLYDKKNSYPSQLSGGQKQRVGIARALANKPKYLLLDEATSALDYKTSIEIIELLKKIKKEYNLTIVFISHQIEILKEICDRIIVMEDGKIVEDKETIQLFINPEAEATKSLIKSVVLDTVDKTDKDVYQIIYHNNDYGDALLSKVVKKYDCLINIVSAKTIDVDSKTIGFLHVNITGTQVKEAIEMLIENKLEVKKL